MRKDLHNTLTRLLCLSGFMIPMSDKGRWDGGTKGRRSLVLSRSPVSPKL
jgi:hypothetical protein